MTKNQLFTAAGTLALAVGAFLTTNAHNKKFATAATGYIRTAGNAIKTVFKGSTAAAFTTVKASPTWVTLLIKTGASGGIRTVFAVKTGSTLSKTVFFK